MAIICCGTEVVELWNSLTCTTDSLQEEIQQLLVNILIDVDLWGEKDCAGIGHSEILATHRIGQKFLWHFSDLWRTQSTSYFTSNSLSLYLIIKIPALGSASMVTIPG